MSGSYHGIVHESDLTLPALRLLSESAGGFLQTADLIIQLEDLFKPVGKDAEVIDGRNDTHFSQKVRNIISHRNSSSNPIKKGWIEYDENKNGLKITDQGLDVLKSFT